MYVCMYVCMYAYMYVCIHVCMYVCIYIELPKSQPTPRFTVSNDYRADFGDFFTRRR